MSPLRWAYLVIVAASLGACTDASPRSDTGDLGAGSPDASESCEARPLPLYIDRADGYPSRVFAPVRLGDTDSAFLFDTGSALSFIHLGASGPDFVPDAGMIQLGCTTLTLPGRGISSMESIAGRPVTGTLGADRLLLGRVELDLVSGALLNRTDAMPVAGTDAWRVLAFENVQGQILVTVRVDGESLRLMLDTGSQHTLWLGLAGAPGDTAVQTTDATGTSVTLYLGTANMEMAGEASVSVPIFRAPSFPYFEETVRRLGGNIQGLLGLSALGARRLIVEAAAKQIRLGPRAD